MKTEAVVRSSIDLGRSLKNRSLAPTVLRVRPLSAERAFAPAYKEPPNACTDAFSKLFVLPTS